VPTASGRGNLFDFHSWEKLGERPTHYTYNNNATAYLRASPHTAQVDRYGPPKLTDKDPAPGSAQLGNYVDMKQHQPSGTFGDYDEWYLFTSVTGKRIL